ncbi:MAG: formate--tetrahydrofolate ligase [Ilumatobacteraceae bacterium]
MPTRDHKTHLAGLRRLVEGGACRLDLVIDEVRLSAGAGFVTPICGSMATMPGLGSSPAAHRIDVDANGETAGSLNRSGVRSSDHHRERRRPLVRGPGRP